MQAMPKPLHKRREPSARRTRGRTFSVTGFLGTGRSFRSVRTWRSRGWRRCNASGVDGTCRCAEELVHRKSRHWRGRNAAEESAPRRLTHEGFQDEEPNAKDERVHIDVGVDRLDLLAVLRLHLL